MWEYLELWLRKAGVGALIVLIVWTLWFLLKALLRDGKWLPYGLTGRLESEGTGNNWRARVFWMLLSLSYLSLIYFAYMFTVSLFSRGELFDPFNVSSPENGYRARNITDFILNIVCMLLLLTVSLEFWFDVFRLSFRRVYAIAKFAIMEAVRKKVLWVFLMLGIVVLFASWFITTENKKDQWGQYTNLVFYVITTIVLVTSSILACFSLPTDIKQQTIFTVTTKPVQTVEIIFGRILGLVCLMSFVLLVSGAISIIYVARGVDPEVASQIRARNVQYCNALLFHDISPQGTPVIKARGGENIGRTWDYFQYLSGGTGQEAVWYFKNLPTSLAQNRLIRLEATFDIFRTSKGGTDRFEQGVAVQFYFVNGSKWKNNFEAYRNARDPKTNLPLSADEKARIFGYYELEKPARVFDEGEPTYVSFPSSILADSTPDTVLEVHVMCNSSSQYLGTAEKNLYLIIDESNWIVNYFKALLCIWMYMILVVTLGVVASTYLNAPISLLLTIMIVIMGQPDILNYIKEESLPDDPITRPGGRLFEASLRLINKDNLVAPLADNAATRTAVALDGSVRYVFKLVHSALPELDIYDRKMFISEGYNIPSKELAATFIKLMLYIFPCLLVGYFLLHGRELAN